MLLFHFFLSFSNLWWYIPQLVIMLQTKIARKELIGREARCLRNFPTEHKRGSGVRPLKNTLYIIYTTYMYINVGAVKKVSI
jgi:hypothetical protein